MTNANLRLTIICDTTNRIKSTPARIRIRPEPAVEEAATVEPMYTYKSLLNNKSLHYVGYICIQAWEILVTKYKYE